MNQQQIINQTEKGFFYWLYSIFGILAMIITIAIFVIVSAQLLSILFGYANNPYEKACKDIGFEDYYPSRDFSLCEDNQSNLHYVKFDCQDIYFKSKGCIAKEISVGGVRVK